MFGDNLRALREHKGLTQGELGKAIGISGRVIGYYEANDRFPKEEKILIDIANFFNVSIDYLLDHEASTLENDSSAKKIFKIFRDKGFVTEGQDISDEVLETITELLDTAIRNAERLNKISNVKK